MALLLHGTLSQVTGNLSLIEEPLIVREYFLTGDVEAELQRHEDRELWCEQISSVEAEDGLCLLYHQLQLLALAVIQLGGQDQASSGTELPIHFVDYVLKNQFFKVDICLRVENIISSVESEIIII